MRRKVSFAAITMCSAMLLMLFSTKTAHAATKMPIPDEYDSGSFYAAECLGACAEDSDEGSDEEEGEIVTSTKATGKSKAEKAANKLVDLGEYWGWIGTVDRVETSKKESSAYVTLTNSKYIFTDIKVKSTSKKTTYTFKDTKYSFNGWKASLKEYSSAEDRQTVLENVAKAAAKKLQEYGSERDWASKLATKFKNKKANTTINFENSKYTYKVVIITARSSNKVTTSYKAQGKSSSIKNIKKMLEKFKAAITADAVECSNECLGSKPDSAIMEDDAKASVSLEADTITNDDQLLSEEPTNSTEIPAVQEDTEVVVPQDDAVQEEETISENNTVSENITVSEDNIL